MKVKALVDETVTDPIVMEGNAVEKTGQIVGLHPNTVYKVLQTGKKTQ